MYFVSLRNIETYFWSAWVIREKVISVIRKILERFKKKIKKIDRNY